jgi:hypothetical protein
MQVLTMLPAPPYASFPLIIGFVGASYIDLKKSAHPRVNGAEQGRWRQTPVLEGNEASQLNRNERAEGASGAGDSMGKFIASSAA